MRVLKTIPAILLAAGRGKRMGSDIRKQYLELGGAPVFSYSLRTLQDYAQIHDIVVVVTPGDEPYMWDYLKKLGQTDKAAATLVKAAERADNNTLSPIYYIQAGQLFESLKQNDKAKECYEKVKKNYPGSPQAQEIEKFIEHLN